MLHDFLVKFMCSFIPEFYMYSVPTKCQALARHSFVIAEETDLVGMEKPKYKEDLTTSFYLKQKPYETQAMKGRGP